MCTTTKSIKITKTIANKKIKDIIGEESGLLIFVSDGKKQKKTQCGYIKKSDIDNETLKKHLESLKKETKYLDSTNR